MASAISKVSPVRFKCLSTVTLGGNEIRYIGVNEENNGVHFPQTVKHCPGRLLFLASDVMYGSKTSRKNFTRVITRFSKSGFAVKMRLTGFKIDGINNGGIIWFFSVQGLFHVAFNLGNMAFQKDCLSQLQDVWLKRYDDPLLPEKGILKYNKRHKVKPQDCVVSDVPHPRISKREIEARKLSSRACASKSILLSDENNTEAREYDIVSYVGNIDNTESVCNCVGMCKCGPAYTREETVSGKYDCSVDVSDDGASAEQNDTDMDCNTTNNEENCNCLGSKEVNEKLICFIQTTFSKELSHPVVQQVMLVLEYSNYFANLEQTSSFENFGCILFKIMEEFLVLVGGVDESSDMFKNTFGISRDKFIILYLISDWLGSEYHNLEDVIKENVEEFKKDNIMCIDTLPSAETIIKSLFPSFMKTFVTNWLGFYNEESILRGKSESVVTSDHCYTQPASKQVPGNTNFQLLQLILEFGSNCLISGIGHVVFSRLQIESCSDS